MNTKFILVTACCLIGPPLLGQNQNPAPNPRQQALEEASHSPINFWGKIVDQDGKPIEGATAKITLSQEVFSEDKREVIVFSDAKGLFSLLGREGIGISIWVSKNGYYSDPDKAGASLNYFMKSKYPQISFRRGGTNQSFPTEQLPTVFVLTAKGQPAVNLILKHMQVPMPKDGTPVDIDLAQARVAAADQGDLKVETWVTDNGQDVVHPFPWKCRVTVLGGGLQPRVGKLDFQAPASNYQSQDEVDMPVTAPRWNNKMMKEYFLQIRGDRYVRMRFWMVSGRNNFLNLDYYINLQAGDRNLETGKQTPF